MTALKLTELSESTIEGAGAFDVLMRATKVHLEQEFTKGRIKGPEYSTVYLGSLQAVMQTSLAYLLQERKNDLEAALLQKQADLLSQQILNAADELLTSKAQRDNLLLQGLQISAQTGLIEQQRDNAILEGKVLVAQECKLRAEYEATVAMTAKSNQELALLTQKTATEKAQTQSLGVDADSVLGRQNALYAAQATGFTRDAEQKVAKLMADTWNVRRTTDEGTVADATNMLNDAAVGRAITKMLTGVGA